MTANRNLVSAWTVTAALAIVLSACTGAAAATDTPGPPAPPTDAPPAATNTPLPPTATASPVPPTETPVPSPTPDLAATAAAAATATAAPIIAMIDGELQKHGLSTEQGRLGWLHEPYTATLDSYLAEDYHTDYPDVTASDFVMQADITWNTTSGAAGCGFALRGSPDIDQGDSYRLYLIRLGPLWDIEYYKGGDFASNLTGFRDALPLNDGLDSTNTVTVIARGVELGIYANGREMDTISDTRLTTGTPAFITWQESGQTTCTFENGWLWILDE
jgi:hypothetical protein